MNHTILKPYSLLVLELQAPHTVDQGFLGGGVFLGIVELKKVNEIHFAVV